MTPTDQSMLPPPVPYPTRSVDALQFGKAEFEGSVSARKCFGCAAEIPSTYYHIDGQVTCPRCATIFGESQRKPGMFFARGVLYGIGAAIAGAAIFAGISLATGYMIGFITVFIGWLVGTAIRKGSAGLGGRRCQIVAVALTYVSMTAGFIPELLQGLKDGAKKREAIAQRDKANNVPSVTQQKAATPGRPLTAGALAFALALVFGVALVSPFLMLTTGIGGFINAFLLFIGMKQAWTLTAADQHVLLGPYEPAAEQPA